MLIAVLASALASDAVWARGKGRSGGAARSSQHGAHHHARSPVFVGGFAGATLAPLWGYAPFPVRAAAVGPLYYIEQSSEVEGEWLYCAGANAYFPYVAECAAGWQRVPVPPALAQP